MGDGLRCLWSPQESAENPQGISGTSGELSPQYQLLAAPKHHHATLVCSLRMHPLAVRNDGFFFFFLIHLLDPIRTPLNWQSLTEERDLGNASPGFPVGIQNRLEAGMTVEADSSLPHSDLQFDCFLRSYLGLDYVGKRKTKKRWCFPSRLSQSITGVRHAPADPTCTPVTVKCSCLRVWVKRMCPVFFRTPDLIQIWRSLIWENLLFSSAFHCYFFRRTGKGVHQKMLNQKDRKQTNVQTNKKYLGLCLA